VKKDFSQAMARLQEKFKNRKQRPKLVLLPVPIYDDVFFKGLTQIMHEDSLMNYEERGE